MRQGRPVRHEILWRGDNPGDVDMLLRNHVAEGYKQGEEMRIIGLGGLDILLNPGDKLIREGDRLGVLRPPPQIIT